jgi:hypothetical protein
MQDRTPVAGELNDRIEGADQLRARWGTSSSNHATIRPRALADTEGSSSSLASPMSSPVCQFRFVKPENQLRRQLGGPAYRCSTLFLDITSAHLAMSVLRKVVRSSGEVGPATMPIFSNRLWMSLSASTSTMALLS